MPDYLYPTTSGYLGNVADVSQQKIFPPGSVDPSTVTGVKLQVGDVWQQANQLQAPSPRPTGANYVRYEDLVQPGDTLQQTLNRCTGGKIVTFPTGTFYVDAFTNGYYDGIRIGSGGATGCSGIVGSGRGTVFTIVANSTSSTIQSVGNKTTGTNPLYLMNIAGLGTQAVLQNFTLQGTPQGCYYNGIQVGQNTAGALVDGLYLLGASPGYANTPPGETFGINIWQTDNATVSNCEVDGRNANGTRLCASPCGWNSCNNATITDSYFHHSLASTLTFWQIVGITTKNVRVEYNGSGSGSLSAQGINHERVTGTVRHYNPSIIINRSGGNTGLHMSLLNDQANDSDVQVLEPTFDSNGVPDNGCFSVMISDNYGTGEKQTSLPTVVYKTVTLVGLDANSAGTSSTASPTANFVRYH